MTSKALRNLLGSSRSPTPATAAGPVSEVNHFDLAFIVDTTGSMGGLIQAAQRRMVAMVNVLAKAGDANVRLAVVEYRDHPPQDTMVFRVHPFAEDLPWPRRNKTFALIS
jgi:hypothetical protein